MEKYSKINYTHTYTLFILVLDLAQIDYFMIYTKERKISFLLWS